MATTRCSLSWRGLLLLAQLVTLAAARTTHSSHSRKLAQNALSEATTSFAGVPPAPPGDTSDGQSLVLGARLGAQCC